EAAVQPQTLIALGRLKKGQRENDAEQAENAHGSTGGQCAAENNGGSLAYPERKRRIPITCEQYAARNSRYPFAKQMDTRDSHARHLSIFSTSFRRLGFGTINFILYVNPCIAVQPTIG
ncbi:MAG: hypothetical protein LBC63_00950, partial [Holophagales bacterium]|nr:hypothetical protein [Holophagales bacterium]